MAGGGGYGPAKERDPALVLRDVVLGRVSVAHAREAYGVAIVADGDGFSVDAAGTARLRRNR